MKDNPDNEFEILNQIGQGSYATVYKAINKQTGEICAIKKIALASEPMSSLKNEIQILSECKCENIVRYIRSDCGNTEVSICMEYCSGGSVKDVMRTLNCTINQEQLCVIIKDVLKGLEYLHLKKRIHRDVKAANILLTQDGIAKLGDFGVSETINSSNNKIIGTPLWLPPEVINGDLPIGTSIDIWSLGITVIEMGDGQPPYNDIKEKEAFAEIKNLTKSSPTFKDPSLWPQNFLNFVSQCLDKDHRIRKNASELLEHDIVKSVQSNYSLRDLVKKIFSTKSKKAESERTLTTQTECKLRNTCFIFNKYKECRMKVVRFDQINDTVNSLNKKFGKLTDNIANRHSRIEDLRAKYENIKQENAKLESRRNGLRKELEDLQKKNRITENNIDFVKLKIAEADRKQKLASLGNKVG